jgi:small subunit ribosomal protein S6
LATTVYEGMFLLDSNRYGRDPDGVAGQIPQMIRDVGGEVLVSRLWEERRLAYAIKGRRKGTYWLTYFRVDGPKLTELKRKARLSDDVLRALFIKIDPRIVDTLVEHAKAGTVKPASPPEGGPGRKRAAGSADDREEADETMDETTADEEETGEEENAETQKD